MSDNYEPMSNEDKKFLIELSKESARRKILNWNLTASKIAKDLEQRIEKDIFQQHLACFITITNEDDELRGCMGSMLPTRPLWKDVVLNSIATATRDWRFDPIQRAELDKCFFEITILSDFNEIQGPENIEIGKHGLYIESGKDNRGILLPQVAEEFDMEPEDFIEAVCVKADLRLDAVQSGSATLKTFTALECFSG